MGVLEQVMAMRNQGMDDQSIILNLQEQGISPKFINDALNQANIKSAVGNSNFDPNADSEGINNNMDEEIPNPDSGIHKPKTIESNNYYAPPAEESYSEMPANSDSYSPSPTTTYQEYYPQQESGGYSGGTDADTIIEISQQVFNEKIKKIKQTLDEIEEFKTVYQVKVDGMHERLKRIENSFDRLQIDILDRVGSYGKGIETVKRELEMVQNSFGKIANDVMDKSEHHTHHVHPHTTTHPSQNPTQHPTPHHVVHKPARTSSKSKKKK